MNKSELVTAVSKRTGLSKKVCDTVLAALLAEVEQAMKNGDKVQLVGFGSFEIKERAARTGRNPRTNEAVQIPASKFPVFKAGKALKDSVQ